MLTTIDLTVRRPKSVDFLSEDTGAVEAVSERLTKLGVEVVGFRDVNALTAGMGSPAGTILVLDTRTLPPDQDVAQLLGHIERLRGGRPTLVCVAHAGDIDLRLQALRAGTEAFFVNPVGADELASRLFQLSGAPGAGRSRILVVDDQPVAAVFAARVLENAGMETRIAGDPLRVLDILEEFRADLVLMDLRMPGVNGIELTTLIREHETFFDIPIVFLSSELDKDKQLDALRVGGNDFIAKPVRPERLVETVRRGIQSFRSMHERMPMGAERDHSVGLMSPPAFLRRLDSSILHRIEDGPGNGLLVIEIDSLGRTDTAADQPHIEALMKRLANLLRTHLGKFECATRYDDMRFVILARRESEGALVELARTLRAGFISGAGRESIEVRVGIGGFDPPADNALTMISQAEKACTPGGEGDEEGVGIYRPLASKDVGIDPVGRLGELIEGALRSEGFQLLYLPIVALREATGERYDTALRLRAPDGECSPAFDFLPAAQRLGLMPAIDRWVMEHALDRLKQEHDTHKQLQVFVHQNMETLQADDWLPWFRNQIVKRELIKRTPILQFRVDDLYTNVKLAVIRFGELRRLAVRTCLNLPEGDSRVLGLTRDLGAALVRLPLPPAPSIDTERLTDFVDQAHAADIKVIVTHIDNPQSIARVFACGVDFIQGNFLQLPSNELSFDFREAALG